MGTVIVYATKYGCTEKCARLLAEQLDGEVDLVNLKHDKNMDLSNYDKVIIGGSIYAGRIRKETKNFCTMNVDQLKNKQLGLFICAMSPEAESNKALEMNFPAELLGIAKAKGCLGGEFQIDKMGFLDKFIVKKVSKVTENKSDIHKDKIQQFAKAMN